MCVTDTNEQKKQTSMVFLPTAMACKLPSENKHTLNVHGNIETIALNTQHEMFDSL